MRCANAGQKAVLIQFYCGVNVPLGTTNESDSTRNVQKQSPCTGIVYTACVVELKVNGSVHSISVDGGHRAGSTATL